MTTARIIAAFVVCALLPAMAADTVEAVHRANGENYKDRVLAACVSAAYQGSPAGEDADTKIVSLEWTYYDDKGNPVIVSWSVERELHLSLASRGRG